MIFRVVILGVELLCIELSTDDVVEEVAGDSPVVTWSQLGVHIDEPQVRFDPDERYHWEWEDRGGFGFR